MIHGLVDIHQHLIYQVDDGPRCWADTVAMLESAAQQGIERIVATSHVFPGRVHFEYQDYLKKISRINKYAEQQKWKLRVLPGAEIYYTSRTLKKLEAQEIPTLAGSRYVLVEFMPEVSDGELFNGLRTLANGGYKPILAHVERYLCLQKEPEKLKEIHDLGVLIQMNAQTVLRSQGLFGGKKYIRKLLKENLVDFVATDAHNCASRPVCLQDAYTFIEKHYGQDLADLLTWKKQLSILPCLNDTN